MIELRVLQAAPPPALAPEHDIRSVLPWRGWAQGLAEAATRRLPLLCLAEDPWSNGAQRLALFLQQDHALREQAADAFVPVLVDAAEHPVVVDQALHVAHLLLERVGPPLLAVCTEEGLPYLAYGSMLFEGAEGQPTLLGLLQAAAEHYLSQREACLHEAKRLLRTPAPEGAGQRGSRYLPAYELWRLLEAGEVREVAERSRLLLRGGVHDQLAGSFHRATRDDRWALPHFEKTAVQNAVMAAVLARTAAHEADRDFEVRDFQAAAEACAGFALRALEQDSAGLASDTAYYTWHAGEILAALPPEELQVVGLHHRVSAASTRHVLTQTVPLDEVTRLAGLRQPEEVRQLLVRGHARLLSVRDQRPAPATLPPASLTARLYALRWLLEAGRQLPILPLPDLLERLDALLGDADLASGTSAAGSLLRQQVAAAHAARAAARSSRGGPWASRALSLALAATADQGRSPATAEDGSGTVGRFDHELPGVLNELSALRTGA